MGRELRQLADKLIMESTTDGKLDLKKLQRLSNEHVHQTAVQDRHISAMTRDGTLEARKNLLMDRLTIATREVLGIIPKEKWSDNDSEPLLIAWFKWATNPAEQPPKNGLECHAPEGVSLGDISVRESLASKGVKCTKSDRVARE